METKAVGMRIKQVRENANITQSELAAAVGCTMQHIGAIERGIKTPRLDTFIQIACILQVPADLLLQDILPRTSDPLGIEFSASIAPLPDEIKRGILKAVTFRHNLERYLNATNFAELVESLRGLMIFLKYLMMLFGNKLKQISILMALRPMSFLHSMLLVKRAQ